MRYREILDEKLLMSEYTFGFELEAVYQHEGQNTNIREKVNNIITSYGFSSTNFHRDSSIKFDLDTELGFEWSSEVLQFTPSNIKKCISLLSSLKKHNIATNDSCGFHIHIGSSKMSLEDRIWVYLQLCSKTEYIEQFTSFINYNFSSSPYAEPHEMHTINKAIIDNTIETIIRLIDTEKYKIIRLHPIGTLEWRGPRDFLQNQNLQEIKGFFKKLYSIISLINTVKDNTSIGNISKEEFFKQFNKHNIDSDLLTKDLKKIDSILDAVSDNKISKKLINYLQNSKINLSDFTPYYSNKLIDIYVTVDLLDKLYEIAKDSNARVLSYIITIIILINKAHPARKSPKEILKSIQPFGELLLSKKERLKGAPPSQLYYMFDEFPDDPILNKVMDLFLNS